MAGLGLGLGISSATSGNTSGIIPPIPGIAGLLIIVYLAGTLVYMGMELEMMADDYEYHIRLHNEMLSYEEDNT